MASPNPSPRFMDATQASKGRNLVADDSLPVFDLNTPVNSTTRRGQLMAIATGPLRHFVKKDSRRKASPALEISRPYGFRKIDDPLSPSSMQIPEQASKSATVGSSSRCTSPFDKPLPSLPVATIDTDSPLKVRRSLIDATEKPLRKSLSPHLTAEWPALSPQKLTPASEPIPRFKDVKVSLGESIIERVKRLNINDEKGSKRAVSETGKQPAKIDTDDEDAGAKSDSKPVQLRDSVDTLSPVTKIARGIPVAMNSTLPGPRYTQISDIRKSLSSTPLISPGQNKSKTSIHQAVSDPDHIIVGRGRLVDHPGPGRRPGPIRVRSQSRHRVTDGGSPYVIPKRLRSSPKLSESFRKISEDGPKPNKSDKSTSSAQRLLFSQPELVIPESAIDAEAQTAEKYQIDAAAATTTQSSPQIERPYNASPLSLLYGESHSPKGIAIKKTRSTSGASRPSPKSRLSSIPLPSHLVKSKSVCVGSSSTSSPFKSRDQFTTVTEHDVHREDKDADFKHNIGDATALARPGSVLSIPNPAERMSIIPSAAIVEEYLRVKDIEPKDSTSSKLNPTTAYGQDQSDSYQVKSLNRSAPKYGAKLKISDSAHDLLLGDDIGAVNDAFPSKNSNLANILHLSSSKDQLRRSGQVIKNNLVAVRDFAERSFSAIPGKETSNVVDRKNDGAEKALDSFEDDPVFEQLVKSAGSRLSLSAPPIKSGPVRDTSSSTAWPLRESIVAPFEQVNPESVASPSTSLVVSVKPLSISTQETVGKSVKLRNSSHDVKPPTCVQTSTTEAPPRVSSRNIARKPVPVRIENEGTAESGVQDLSSKSQSKTPVSRTTQPKFMKPFSRGSAQARTDSKEKKQRSVSPDAVPGAVSTGKGKAVMSNIRGLFHKRSTEQANGYKKLHQSLKAHKAAVQSGSSPDVFPERPSRMPSSPQVKLNSRQTIQERRQARQESETFKRGHRDIATITPRTPKSPGTPEIQQAATRYILEPFPELDLSSPGPAVDANMPENPLDTATKLAHSLLDRANNESNMTRKTELIEMSSVLIQVLQIARIAEKAKEEARYAAARAEVECLKVNHRIATIANVITDGLNNGFSTINKVHDMNAAGN